MYCVTSEDAVEAYLLLMKEMETQGFTRTHTLPPEVECLASYSLQQVRQKQNEDLFYSVDTVQYVHNCIYNVSNGCKISSLFYFAASVGGEAELQLIITGSWRLCRAGLDRSSRFP